PLSAHVRLREHRVRAQEAEAAEAGDRDAGSTGGSGARVGGGAQEEASDALGRATTAGRDGPRDRARAPGVPYGRAPLEPRRQAQGRDEGGDREAPARSRRD